MARLLSTSRLIVKFCFTTLSLYVLLSSATLSPACRAIADSLPPGNSSECSMELPPPVIVQTYIGGYETICIVVSDKCMVIHLEEMIEEKLGKNYSNGYLVGSLPLKKILANMTLTFSVFDKIGIALKDIMTKVVVHDMELNYTRECNGANMSWKQLPDFEYSLITDCNSSANLTNSSFLQLVQCKASCNVTFSGRRLNGLGGSPEYLLDVVFFDDPSLSIESQQFSLEQENTNTQLIYSLNLSSQCTSKQPCELRLHANGVNFTVNLTKNFASIFNPKTTGLTVSIPVYDNLPEHLTAITATAEAWNPVGYVQVTSTIEIPHPTNPANDNDMGPADASTPAQDSEVSDPTDAGTPTQENETSDPVTPDKSPPGAIIASVLVTVFISLMVGALLGYFVHHKKKGRGATVTTREDGTQANIRCCFRYTRSEDIELAVVNNGRVSVGTPTQVIEFQIDTTTPANEEKPSFSEEKEALSPLRDDEQQPSDGSTAVLVQGSKESTVADPQSLKVIDAPTLVTPTLVTPTQVTEEVSESGTANPVDEKEQLLPKKKEPLIGFIGVAEKPRDSSTAVLVQEVISAGPSANIVPQDHFQQPKEPTVLDPQSTCMVTPIQVTEVSESDTSTTVGELKPLITKKQKAPRPLRGDDHPQRPTFSKQSVFTGGPEQPSDGSTAALMPGEMSARPSANIAPQYRSQQPKYSTTLDPQLMNIPESDAAIVVEPRQLVNPVHAANRSEEENDEFLMSPNQQSSLNFGDSSSEMVSHK